MSAGEDDRESTREAVSRLLGEGRTKAAIAKELNVSEATVCHHARALGYPADARFARRYDWAEVQAYYDLGHSVRECRGRFGFAKQSWNDAVNRGAVVARPHAMPLDELLVAGRRSSRWNVKRRILAAGLAEGRCEECGIEDWRGKPLELDLHHRNGDRDDNRLENLALLCPNCHRQTDTFGVRNRRAA
jgi:HNH endonuclease